MKSPAAGPEDRLFVFGSFVADPVMGALRENGSTVSLTLKTFEVLIALLERRGQIVEKDLLLKLVWPDTIVEENNLARHISTLRKALNDHPTEPQYVVTVVGRGYRFVAPVQETTRGELAAALTPPVNKADDYPSDGAIRTAAAESAVPGQAMLPFSRPVALVAAAVLAAVIASIAIVADFGRSQPESPDRKLWQLTSSGGLESDATWAPNGDSIAYSSDRTGNFDIWVQPVGEGIPVRLTSSPAHDWQPSWSADGRVLAFRSERDGGGIYAAPVGGGAERKIANFGYRPRWSPTQPRLFFSSSNVVKPKLYVVEASGEHLRRVLGEFLDNFLTFRTAWHPDGQRISVYGNHRRNGLSFWTVPLDGGVPVQSALSPEVMTRLKKSNVTLAEFSWAPKGDALYFEGRSEDAVNIWRVHVDPNTLEWRTGPDRLTMGGGLDTNIALSPDGHKLAFTVRNERTRLWSFPFDANEGRMLGPGEPVSSRGTDALYPDVPADGSRLIYRTSRHGKQELWNRSLVDGEDALVAAAAEITAPRWSGDGTQLAFRRQRPLDADGVRKEGEIVLLSADGGHERLLTTPGPKSLTPYDWSADGVWIVGACEQGPARLQSVCLLPVSGAPRAQDQMRIVASDPERNLYQATFSPNQRWIAFNATRSDGLSTIYVVAMEGGQWTAFTEGTFWDDKPRWSPDGRTLYFVSNRSGFLNVWARHFDPASGKPSGDVFRVSTFENPSERVSSPVNSMELAIAPHQMILPIVEASGSVWVLENIDR